MEKIAPLHLGESWDNVGVLLEAPSPRIATKVFLTIDLTNEVLEEALSDSAVGVIVAYHPPLFRSFKRLVLSDEKSKIALVFKSRINYRNVQQPG
jgi:putative NIF3 family GTP cyclohydrolase 1 type 2